MAKFKNQHPVKVSQVREATTKVASKRGRKPVDPNETADQRFVRLCGMRVSKVLVLLKGIERCSDTSQYDYEPEMVEKMLKDLKRGIIRIEKAYATGKPSVNGIVANYFSR